jgi:hypothetical protein
MRANPAIRARRTYISKRVRQGDELREVHHLIAGYIPQTCRAVRKSRSAE